MEKPSHPRWETGVMIVSFALLWVWILARHHPQLAPDTVSGKLWAALQIAALVALFWIFLRRLSRVRHAMKEVGEKQFGFVSRRKMQK